MKKRIGKTRIFCTAVLAFLCLLGACGKSGPAPESTPVPASTSAAETAGGSTAAGSKQSTAQSTEQPAASTEALPADSEAVPGTAEPGPESTVYVPVSMDITLVSLNIKHGAEGLETIAAAIRELSPDIVGLQEVDVFCERSGYADEVTELARLAGYPYHAFARAIPLGSGEYGTALLSRFPIETFDVTPLDSGYGEPRALGHAVIDAEGIRLDVFVTHLSFEDRDVRIGQLKTIAARLKECSRYILLGDLNTFVIEDVAYLDAAYCVNRPERRYQTFQYRNSSPDNIAVSEGFTELSSGASDAKCSDHKLLWAVFRLEGE